MLATAVRRNRETIRFAARFEGDRQKSGFDLPVPTYTAVLARNYATAVS